MEYAPGSNDDGWREAADQRRGNGRAKIDIECDIRVGTKAWRKAHLADLTPDGFQVATFDMPQRGTALYIRFAGLQLQQAEVCWTTTDTAGCRFVAPLSPYVFDHILTTAD